MKPLANHNEQSVTQTAHELTQGKESIRSRIEAIFQFVRDEIRFGFPPKGDLTTAQETIKLGYGQCNTKSALFLALCRAVHIEARIHFSLITREIQRGVFPELIFRRLPEQLSHSWIEVMVDGDWRKIDTFINDRPFYLAGKKRLQSENRKTGYSVSCSKNTSSDRLDLDNEQFVQMDAVTEDHGTWDNPDEYYKSGKYRNRPGAIKLLLYRLSRRMVNRRVRKIRQECSTGLCTGDG